MSERPCDVRASRHDSPHRRDRYVRKNAQHNLCRGKSLCAPAAL